MQRKCIRLFVTRLRYTIFCRDIQEVEKLNLVHNVCQITTAVVPLSPAKSHFRLLSSIALCPHKARCSYNQICSHHRESMKNSRTAYLRQKQCRFYRQHELLRLILRPHREKQKCCYEPKQERTLLFLRNVHMMSLLISDCIHYRFCEHREKYVLSYRHGRLPKGVRYLFCCSLTIR